MLRGLRRACRYAACACAAATAFIYPVGAEEFGVGQYGPDRDGARVSLWNTTQRLRADIRVASGTSFIPAPNGRDYAVLRNGTAYIHRWDAALDYRKERPLGPADALAFSNDAGRIAYAEDYRVRVQEPGRPAVEHAIDHADVTHIGWGDNNTLLFLVAGDPATVLSLDPETGESRAWLRTGRRQLLDIAPAPHDAYVVLMWDDPDAGIAYTMLDTETRTHSQLHTTTHTVPASVSWAPDGETLVLVDSTEAGGHVLLHVDMDNLASHHLLPDGESATAPAFDPDGRFVAYARAHGLGIYDSETQIHEIIVGSEAKRRGGPFWVLWQPPSTAQISSLPPRPALVREQIALATPEPPTPSPSAGTPDTGVMELPATPLATPQQPTPPVRDTTFAARPPHAVPDPAFAPPAPPVPPTTYSPAPEHSAETGITPSLAAPAPRPAAPIVETPLPPEPTPSAPSPSRIALATPEPTFGISPRAPSQIPSPVVRDPLSQGLVVHTDQLHTPEAALDAAIAGLRSNDAAALRAITMSLGDEDGVFEMLASALRHNPDMAAQLADRFAAAAQDPIPWERSPDGATAALPYARPSNRRPYYAFFSQTANGAWMWNLELSMMYENGPLPW